MKNKLKNILLIDDDRITHYATMRIIRQLDCAENVVTVGNGNDALTYLKNNSDLGHEPPDLIFLDINMPGMNGWEFLEAYRKLDKEQHHSDLVIVMLTTSLNADDRERAKGIGEIDLFKNKPLTKEDVQGILHEYFANRAQII